MREEMFVMRGAVTNLVDSSYLIIDIVSIGPLRPRLMDNRDPQIAFVTAVRHVGPETQCEVRDNIVRGRVLAKAVI